MPARSVESAALRRDVLTKSFRGVPLGLKLLGGSIGGASGSIFQMDIQDSPRFGEYFQIWPGASDNQIEVLSFDRALRQLVLRVQEPRRPFFEVVRRQPWHRREEIEARARASGGRILSESKDGWQLELWTPVEDRRYLCGMDDLHLFIAQVRRGDTVAETHESLRPRAVAEAEAVWPGHIQRQGEWFFLPISAAEAARIDAHAAQWRRSVKRQASVGEGRRPHVAERVITIVDRVKAGRRERRVTRVYARGRVAHSGHRDLYLDGWRRVVRNRELVEPVTLARGFRTWID